MINQRDLNAAYLKSWLFGKKAPLCLLISDRRTFILAFAGIENIIRGITRSILRKPWKFVDSTAFRSFLRVIIIYLRCRLGGQKLDIDMCVTIISETQFVFVIRLHVIMSPKVNSKGAGYLTKLLMLCTKALSALFFRTFIYVEQTKNLKNVEEKHLGLHEEWREDLRRFKFRTYVFKKPPTRQFSLTLYKQLKNIEVLPRSKSIDLYFSSSFFFLLSDESKCVRDINAVQRSSSSSKELNSQTHPRVKHSWKISIFDENAKLSRPPAVWKKISRCIRGIAFRGLANVVS